MAVGVLCVNESFAPNRIEMFGWKRRVCPPAFPLFVCAVHDTTFFESIFWSTQALGWCTRLAQLNAAPPIVNVQSYYYDKLMGSSGNGEGILKLKPPYIHSMETNRNWKKRMRVTPVQGQNKRRGKVSAHNSSFVADSNNLVDGNELLDVVLKYAATATGSIVGSAKVAEQPRRES